MTAYKEDALPMTDQEIAQSYREAKNQIGRAHV